MVPSAPALTSVPPTWACTVCGVGQVQTEWAYVAMTAVLSLLPLGLLGGIAYGLYRRSLSSERQQGRG